MPRKKRNYKIGYGKPPKHTRWKPGQSGNPGGRLSDLAAAYLFFLNRKKNPEKKLGKMSISAIMGILKAAGLKTP